MVVWTLFRMRIALTEWKIIHETTSNALSVNAQYRNNFTLSLEATLLKELI